MSLNMHVTVAALVERDRQFLMVEEAVCGRLMLNQPAGHLEPGESLIEAVKRETIEETARRFEPRWLLGVYQSSQPDGLWLRFAFVGEVGEPDPSRELDADIHAARFIPLDEIRARPERHRSLFVEACLGDYLAGRRLPLEALRYYDRREGANGWQG